MKPVPVVWAGCFRVVRDRTTYRLETAYRCSTSAAVSLNCTTRQPFVISSFGDCGISNTSSLRTVECRAMMECEIGSFQLRRRFRPRTTCNRDDIFQVVYLCLGRTLGLLKFPWVREKMWHNVGLQFGISVSESSDGWEP
jgi:hypothetical protein